MALKINLACLIFDISLPRMNKVGLFWMVFSVIFFGCHTSKETGNKKLTILCTTGIVQDLVKNVVGDHADVGALMGAGVDPHVFKASQGDIQKFYAADLIVVNGLHLEGKLAEILSNLKKLKPVYVLSSVLNEELLLQTDPKHKIHDPHIWFDVSVWSECVQGFGNYISKFDTTHQKEYLSNTTQYRQSLSDLHQWAGIQTRTIPVNQRVLITSHDAFNYFGRAYKVEVVGLQGISTMSEYGIRDISNIVSMITNRKIPAVFIESSVSSKSLMAVIESCKKKKHHVVNGGMIYSDALGKEGTPEGTYIGMVKHNVNTIVTKLTGIKK